jgi:hypothetical protein
VGINLALVSAAVILAGPWGIPAVLALTIGGTLLQFSLVEAGLRFLERFPGSRRALAWGWTARWGRYRAPRPGA